MLSKKHPTHQMILISHDWLKTLSCKKTYYLTKTFYPRTNFVLHDRWLNSWTSFQVLDGLPRLVCLRTFCCKCKWTYLSCLQLCFVVFVFQTKKETISNMKQKLDSVEGFILKEVSYISLKKKMLRKQQT